MAGSIPEDIIQEIKARTDIVELIGSFVQLKRSGSGSFKGLCPFHQEKTPSFHVDGARQMFHCFGCGKGGDVVRFYMDKENLPFTDAVRMLATRAGVIIPEQDRNNPVSPDAARRKSMQRERLFEANRLMAGFFQENLRNNPRSPAAQYLAKRGIPFEVAQHFGIGVAPDGWTGCLDFAAKYGFSGREMAEAGLARSKENTNRFYDQFRNRITFAIANEHGRICGFSARSLEPKPVDGGKYVNTPETMIFRKGQLLYALPLARKAIGEKSFAILCEGQMDTIAFHRAGFDCAVAPLGTAFTPEQAKILKRYTSRIVLAFDADGAGQKAVERAAEILLPLSIDVKVMQIPGGKDPDELYSTGGSEAVAQAVNSARPLLQVLTSRLPEKFDLSSAVGRGQAAAWMANFLKLVENRIELESYVLELSSVLRVSPDAVYAELANVRKLDRRRDMYAQGGNLTPAVINPQNAPENAPAPAPFRKSYPVCLLSLLELACCSGDAARMIGELLPPEDLQEKDPVTNALNILIDAALEGDQAAGIEKIKNRLAREPVPEISRILIQNNTFSNIDKAVSDCVRDFKFRKLKEKSKALQSRISSVADPQERLDLLQEAMKINQEIKNLNRVDV